MMYLHLEHKSVPADRRTEAIERLTRLHGLMAAAPGFIDAQICAGLDDPSQYLITRAWQDAAAHAAYRASPAQQEYARNRPASLPWENLAVQEWETIVVSEGGDSGNHLVRTLYDVHTDGWDAFVTRRRQHDETLVRSGGLVYVRSYRPLSGAAAAEALELTRHAGGESYERALESVAADSEKPRLRERYEVVVEAFPRPN